MTSTFSKTTLRPGLLVSVKTSVTGNVSYIKRDLEDRKIGDDGIERATWETTREVVDAKEQEAATKVRNKARTAIARVCVTSAFGFLCREDREADLAKAVAEAREYCDAFNATATVTRLKFLVYSGRVASDDVEAVKAINSEVRELVSAMERGVKALDVEEIRDAANRLKAMSEMLTPDASARVFIAIEAARKTASTIKAAADVATVEIDRRTLQTLAETRTAFLDLEDAAPIAAPAGQARGGIDLAPATLPVNALVGDGPGSDRTLELI